MNRTIAVVVMACGMACSQTATESVHRLNNSVDSLLQTVLTQFTHMCRILHNGLDRAEREA